MGGLYVVCGCVGVGGGEGEISATRRALKRLEKNGLCMAEVIKLS